MQTQNKVIVVTGGGSGIGTALTLRLVNAGARVAAIDIHENALQETQGLAGPHKSAISLHVVNVTEREAVNALPETVIAAHDVWMASSTAPASFSPLCESRTWSSMPSSGSWMSTCTDRFT